MDRRSVEEHNFGLNCSISIFPRSSWDRLHRHDEIEMSFFVTRKPVMFRIGGQLIVLDRSSTVLFWAAVPHQILITEQRVIQYYITIPPEIFLGWQLPDSLTNGILNGSIFMEKDRHLRRMDIASFPVWIREATDTQNPQRHIALSRSMEGRIRRFGGAAQPVLTPFSGKTVLPAHSPIKTNKTFLRIVDYITHNYKNDIMIDDIAEAVDMHPNYIISLFRKESGINITRYILMLRIYESQRLLLATDMKIIDIAMEVGFGSMSNFYKYFKRVCRKNPKDYRKILEI
jgi:AraC-like DNA-binding protein